MKISRRSFLKLAGGATATATLTGLSVRSVAARSREPIRVHYAKEVPSICTFCGVGCGIICHVRDGKVINAEGDPNHPINEGTLCSKGSSITNISYLYNEKGKAEVNPRRLTQVLYRAPGSDKYEVKDWDWALDTIADRIRETRDRTFVETADVGGRSVTVNRTNAINWLGSAWCTSEENYLFHKMTRAMGLINIDHCARL